MRKNLKALNSKEVKTLTKDIKDHFGSAPDLKKHALYRNREGKIYLLSRERLNDVDLSKLRINRVGMYFGKEEKGGFRPSIEGSQLINPKKNFVEVKKGMVKLWMAGHDLEIKADVEGLVIIKAGDDILGCGRYKEGKVLNFVPKDRRIKGSFS